MRSAPRFTPSKPYVGEFEGRRLRSSTGGLGVPPPESGFELPITVTTDRLTRALAPNERDKI